jgi:ATP-dependent Lon protease
MTKSTTEKLKSVFSDTLVYKSAMKNKFLQALGIPSFLRDWLVMRFSDEQGQIDSDQVFQYVRKTIPRKEHWESLKSDMIHDGVRARFLAKIRVEIDVKTGEGLFSLPDLGFPTRKYEAVIDPWLLREKKTLLLTDTETWGVIETEWKMEPVAGSVKEQGRVRMVDFKPFSPYQIDLSYFQEARKEFSFEEWIDIILTAIDYSPIGFLDIHEKLAMLTRLLPFLEKRLNIIELAPKGTGKSYLFSQISRYGWLISGGSVTRARLFYDINRRSLGLVSRYDYVALDEIQSISFSDEAEIRGALKGYLESPSGEYRIGDFKGIGEGGVILLGNISLDSMDDTTNMFLELPHIFQESALLDRFHGFIKGWEIPRIKENMKAEGWGLNAEYFSEIMHALREDIRYRSVVDELLSIPKGADTRDTEAIKRLTTAFVKLLFPHVITVSEINIKEINEYCVKPAIAMRHIIRKQLHILDNEYGDIMPDIALNDSVSNVRL